MKIIWEIGLGVTMLRIMRKVTEYDILYRKIQVKLLIKTDETHGRLKLPNRTQPLDNSRDAIIMRNRPHKKLPVIFSYDQRHTDDKSSSIFRTASSASIRGNWNSKHVMHDTSETAWKIINIKREKEMA